MFNAVSLAFSFVPLLHSVPPLSIYGRSLPFGIDPPLAANEMELCFLGLETSDFWVLDFWIFLMHSDHTSPSQFLLKDECLEMQIF